MKKMRMTMRFLQIAIPFIWLGLVVGLSFVETPLKFKAPGITVPLGLGIGRLVFAALNRIEIVFALLLLMAYWFGSAGLAMRLLFGAIAAIVLLQTFWLLPALGERTALAIAGNAPPKSNHHQIFIVLEASKVLALLALGIVTAQRYLNSFARS
jgi:hypothetical protein